MLFVLNSYFEGCLPCIFQAIFFFSRALEYVHVFLTCLVYDSKGGSSPDNLCPYFNKAYEEKLKPYHGWFVQKLFGVSPFILSKYLLNVKKILKLLSTKFSNANILHFMIYPQGSV